MPIEAADEELGRDVAQRGKRVVVDRLQRDMGDQQRRQRQSDGQKRRNKPHLRWNARLVKPGINIKAAPIRQNKNRTCPPGSMWGPKALRRIEDRSRSRRSFKRSFPGDSTSKPRAISSCDNTGSRREHAAPRSCGHKAASRPSRRSANSSWPGSMRLPASTWPRPPGPNCSTWRGSMSNSTTSPFASRLRLWWNARSQRLPRRSTFSTPLSVKIAAGLLGRPADADVLGDLLRDGGRAGRSRRSLRG